MGGFYEEKAGQGDVPTGKGVAWGLGLLSGGGVPHGVVTAEGRGLLALRAVGGGGGGGNSSLPMLPLPAPPSASSPARLLPPLLGSGSSQYRLTQCEQLNGDGSVCPLLPVPSTHISNNADNLVLFLLDLFLTTLSAAGTSQFEIWENVVRNLFFEAFLNDVFQ